MLPLEYACMFQRKQMNAVMPWHLETFILKKNVQGICCRLTRPDAAWFAATANMPCQMDTASALQRSGSGQASGEQLVRLLMQTSADEGPHGINYSRGSDKYCWS